MVSRLGDSKPKNARDTTLAESMTLNESIVEDAALAMPKAALTRPLPRGEERELGYPVGHGAAFAGLRRAKPPLAPGEPAAERDSFGEVVLVGRLRDVIRRLNPAIPLQSPF